MDFLKDASLETGGQMFRLMRAWNIQAQKIDSWSRRMLSLREKNQSPSMIRKLTKMMDQILLCKKQEQKIIEKIEEIEKKHNYMKQKKLLRQAPLKPKPAADLAPVEDEEEANEKKWNKFLIYLALLWLMLRKRSSSNTINSQRFTPN